MCGILLIDGIETVAPERLQSALSYLRHRGPNHTRSWHSGRVSIWHTVLHITGNPEYYFRAPGSDFCAFAGEIYNYQELGYDSDAQCVHDIVSRRIGYLRSMTGPNSWIYATADHVCYATDPQGERHLYRYTGSDVTVVASEVAVILALIDAEFDPVAYENKTWTLLSSTPYRGIEKLDPGRLYIDHRPAHVIDSVFDWCQIRPLPSLHAATEEFRWLWRRVIDLMLPSESCTISFSGGIDSGLISAMIPDADLLALDMTGKDPNIARLDQQLHEHQRCNAMIIPISRQHYAQLYKDMIKHTRMPAQSWSHVGKWAVAKHAGSRVIFTGAGADELFGGYGIYQNISYNTATSSSPYSQHHDHTLWQRCLDAYNRDPRPATLLLDYWHQVVGCDSPGLDRAAGAWGRETRNPFMHPDIIKFALALPWHLRVGHRTKPVLKSLWQSLYPDRTVLPKQGFAGHANDSLPWMDIEFESTNDRYGDWQRIAQQTFYEYCRAS